MGEDVHGGQRSPAAAGPRSSFEDGPEGVPYAGPGGGDELSVRSREQRAVAGRGSEQCGAAGVRYF
ncbi:hypothetical protein GCM10010271_08740 [Streptomyces kurssanovii]|nr:hypothetical protein GCM10010271_08740 [Streptomyces kurssanovii]